MNAVALWRRACRRSLARLALVVAAPFTVPCAAADDAEPPGAFPYALAFRMNELRYQDPPTVSPDGMRVAYVVVSRPDVVEQGTRFLENGSPADTVGARVYVSGDGSAAAVCAGRGNQWNPAWSPDGRRLALYSDADGRPNQWIHDVANGQCRRIGDAVIRTSIFRGDQPRWSPDGATVYVPVRLDPPLEISDFIKPPRRETQDAAAHRNAPPQVYLSGSESKAPSGTGMVGDRSKSAMSHYNATLAAVDVASGSVRTVVDARTEQRPATLKVSPSGRWLSYAAVARPESDLATLQVNDIVLVPAAGGSPKLLVEGLRTSEHDANYGQQDYRWHPREDWLVYLRQGRLWRTDVGQDGCSAPRQLAVDLGELAPAVLAFTRDADAVVVGTAPEGEGSARAPHGLALVPLDGRAPMRLGLPDAQWEFVQLLQADEDTLWQPERDALQVLLRHRTTGEEALYRIGLHNGASHRLIGGAFRLAHFGSGGGHRQLFALYQDLETAPDILRYSADLRSRSRVSSIEPRADGLRIGSARTLDVRIPTHDGRLLTVRTILLLPPGAKQGDRLPAIAMVYSGYDLSVHASKYGGGMGNTVPNQVFTTRGFAVLMAHIPLSSQGQPGNPVKDIVDALLPQVYAAAQAGYIDIDRVAISGQSYGGYSTAAIVGQTNLFRAGIPVNGTYDLGGSYARMQGEHAGMIRWAETGQGRMGDSPWANPLRYLDNSPYYRPDRIHTPLLIVMGEDDAITNIDAPKLFAGLRRLERPAQLLVYLGEGHVIYDWSVEHAADVSRRMVGFLRKHLGATGPVPASKGATHATARDARDGAHDTSTQTVMGER